MTTTPEKNTRLSDRLKIENRIDSLREEFDFLEEQNLDWDDWVALALVHQITNQNPDLIDNETMLVDLSCAAAQYVQGLGQELELENMEVMRELWVGTLVHLIKAISWRVHDGVNEDALSKWATTSLGSLAPKTTKGFK